MAFTARHAYSYAPMKRRPSDVGRGSSPGGRFFIGYTGVTAAPLAASKAAALPINCWYVNRFPSTDDSTRPKRPASVPFRA